MPEHEHGLPEPIHPFEPQTQPIQPKPRSIEGYALMMVHTIVDGIARRLFVPQDRIDLLWARFLQTELDHPHNVLRSPLSRSSNRRELQSLLIDFFSQFLSSERSIAEEHRKKAEGMANIRETLGLTPEQVGEEALDETGVEKSIFHAVRLELKDIFGDIPDR